MHIETTHGPDLRELPADSVLVLAWQVMGGWHVRAWVTKSDPDETFNLNQAMKAVVDADSALDGAPLMATKIGANSSERKIGKHRSKPPREIAADTGLLELPPEGEPFDPAGSIVES